MPHIRCSGAFGLWIVWAALWMILAFPTADLYAEQDEKVELIKTWTGDYEGMLERRQVRVLVVPNKMFYFIDKGQPRGVHVDLFREFEKFINGKVKTGARTIRIIFVPVSRDQILTALVEGRGDIAAANLTITKERQKAVDFGDPMGTGVKEILVTGPSAPAVKSLDDLSGQELHLRPSSSYYEHVARLNAAFQKQGKLPIKIVPASEYLEDADLLEMVNADLIPMVIVDDHKARFWGEIFEKITLHPDIAVHEGGEIAWAFRKNSPKLAAVVNEFVKGHKKGTLLGNMLFKRYLKENKWARNALSPAELAKFQAVVDLFKQYADRYDFDYLMTGALAYQESQLDHSKRSQVGAVGIMQILPTTAADKNIGIPDVAKLENNIHAGHKYLRFLQDRYFDDPAIATLDRYLFTFAAYNAGPARVSSLRREAGKRGLDPNVWFQNVEVIAAEKIGRETVQYVSNIYKYYISYKFAREQMEARKKAAGAS
ncbi:MAG: lytic transglycosylase F [Desulfobacteraceae bacterium]|nr:lytic transglycosylase F [Desulfobacteraceae bacterium]MBC2753598.1 lytic transglycosylase F [Desulfobacteraceae bacterium]